MSHDQPAIADDTGPHTPDGSGPVRAARRLVGRLKDALSGHDAQAPPKRGPEVGPPEPEEIRQDGVDQPRPLPGDQPPPK